MIYNAYVYHQIALQNNKIKDLELQLDAKESRLVDALKQKKKKKAKEEQAIILNKIYWTCALKSNFTMVNVVLIYIPVVLQEPHASYLALEADNLALREREHALLSAVR